MVPSFFSNGGARKFARASKHRAERTPRFRHFPSPLNRSGRCHAARRLPPKSDDELAADCARFPRRSAGVLWTKLKPARQRMLSGRPRLARRLSARISGNGAARSAPLAPAGPEGSVRLPAGPARRSRIFDQRPFAARDPGRRLTAKIADRRPRWNLHGQYRQDLLLTRRRPCIGFSLEAVLFSLTAREAIAGHCARRDDGLRVRQRDRAILC